MNHERAIALADSLSGIKGIKIINDKFFNEFVIETPKNANEVVNMLAKHNITAGYPLAGNKILTAATEMTTDDDIAHLTAALKEVL